jgi:hypothetical protein
MLLTNEETANNKLNSLGRKPLDSTYRSSPFEVSGESVVGSDHRAWRQFWKDYGNSVNADGEALSRFATEGLTRVGHVRTSP